MRIILPLVTAVVVAAGAVPIHAQAQSGILGQAQRYLGNGNNNDRNGNSSDSDAYQRGREDEMRRSQADRPSQYRDQQQGRDRQGYNTPYSNDRDYNRNNNR